VAQIGKEQLTAQEVSRAVQNMSRGRQMPAELLAMYVPQMVEQLISDRAMAYEAKRLGLEVSDSRMGNIRPRYNAAKSCSLFGRTARLVSVRPTSSSGV